MVQRLTYGDQQFITSETTRNHNEEWNSYLSGNTADRPQELIPNRRRFLATAAGIGLGTTFSALGSNSVAGATAGDHLLQIRGTGSRATYTFTVSDNLQKSTAGGGTISEGDRITNQNRSASGLVRDGTDAYTFDGDLIAFDLDGEVNVLLDGEPAHVGRRPDHFLQIQGQGRRTTYSFTVGDNLRKSSAGGGSISEGDHIINQNRSASGLVRDGTDAYTFDGDLVAFDFDGEVNVLLDGESAHVGQRPDHFLQIQGQGVRTTYNFTVSDDLQKSTAGGGTISEGDRVTNQNRTASGLVRDGSDTYTFDGDLLAFDFDGEVNVLLDGGSAHVGRLPDSVPPASGSTPQVVWNRRYGDPNLDSFAYAVIPTSDGGYAFAGQSESQGWLVKTDGAGDQQWSKLISDIDRVSSLVQTEDGGFALTGTLYGEVGSAEIYGQLITTDADGNERWRRQFHNRVPNKLFRTDDGGFTLAGERYEYDDTRPSGGWAVRTNSDGQTQWSRTFGNEWGDTFASLVQTRDGGYLFAGGKGTGQYSSHGWAVKTTEAGNEQWSRIYDEGAFGVFAAVQQASTGGYILAGYKDELAWAVHVDEAGEINWNRTYGDSSEYVLWRLEALIPESDGSYIVAGEIFHPDADAVSGLISKIDAAGNRVWAKEDLRPRDYPNGYLYDLIHAHGEGYVVAGTAATEVNSGGNGGWMVKLA
jgi:hypothetical protein